MSTGAPETVLAAALTPALISIALLIDAIPLVIGFRRRSPTQFTSAASLITKRRWLPRLFMVTACLAPISCSAQNPTCSDEFVGEQVKELALELLQQNYGLTAMYNLPATRFDLRAIRTVESDDRRSSCRAELAIEFELNAELKAAMTNPSGNATEKQIMTSMFGNRSRTVDLRYSVELTDDGKDLYVNVERF